MCEPENRHTADIERILKSPDTPTEQHSQIMAAYLLSRDFVDQDNFVDALVTRLVMQAQTIWQLRGD